MRRTQAFPAVSAALAAAAAIGCAPEFMLPAIAADASARQRAEVVAPATFAGYAAAAPACTLRVLVAYYSESGHTQTLAEAAAEGAASYAGAAAVLKPVDDVTAPDLEAADALILASPTHWANMAWPVARLIRDWPYMGDKVGAALATGGAPTGGREHVAISLLLAMLNNGMVVAGPVYEEDGFRFGAFGASAVTGPRDPGVGEDALEDARRTGERVAELATRLREPVPTSCAG